MTHPFDITLTEAKWVLGLLAIEELPELAAAALADGFESDTMVKLAICSINETDEIRRLFKHVLIEAGGGKMSKIEALRYYARQISALILSSEVSPQHGARLIWDATIKAQEKTFHELDGFIYAASEMDDRPDDKAFFERAIIEEAQRWATLKS